MGPINVAVIGSGKMGSYHAQKYDNLSDSNLVAVCDIDRSSGENLASNFGVKYVADYRDLVDRVDAVSVATSTKTHKEIASYFLSQGIHALVEKPLTRASLLTLLLEQLTVFLSQPR